MASYKPLKAALVLALLLNCSMTVTVGVAAPALIQTPNKALTFEKKVKVRANEEKRLASLDKSYAKQMKALAKQYKASAKLVAKQGGDPTALIEAVAYFENESKVQEKKEKTKVK